MSRPIRFLAHVALFTLAIAGALLVAPRQAEALQIRTNPFGNRPTTVVMGSIGNDIWLLYTASEQECRWEYVGDQDNGLLDDYQIDGGDGNDLMYELGPDPDAVLIKCGQVLGFVAAGGKRVSLHGRGGNDYIETGFNPTEMFGGDGNDILLTARGDAFLSGGPGNDTLISQSPVGFETFIGGPGRDCIFDEGANASVVDCGGQSRDRSNIPDPSCPLLVDSCN